ncbi:MAG TPA: hypothetical protein VMC08_06940 [Bacteroidales bacterium]|nr:hypothetical protein [Bacteroidales bacterium]
MKKILRGIALFLLCLNGIGAVFGGLVLMIDPSGKLIGYPLSYLEHSPFTNFLIPGIILFTCIGCFSLLIAWLVIRNADVYPWLLMIQGVILGGWIIIEVIMIRIWYAPLHLTFLLIGGGMTLLGIILATGKKKVVP